MEKNNILYNKELISLNRIFNDYSKEMNILSPKYKNTFLQKIITKEINNCELLEYITDIKYISSGANSYVILFCFKDNESCEENLIMKISQFDDYYLYDYEKGEENNEALPKNVDWLMTEKLYQLYKLDIFPFIAIPIFSFLCNSNENNISHLLKKINTYKEDTVYRFTILENIYSGDLEKFIRENNLEDDDYIFIYFNALLIMHILKKYYPTFKHNDLKISNFLVKKITNKEIKADTISLKVKKFILLINDFDTSCIDNIVPNLLCNSLPDSTVFNDLKKFNESFLSILRIKNVSPSIYNFIKTAPDIKNKIFQKFYREINDKTDSLLKFI